MAAGLKCTLANSAYNARELGYQYADSGAELVFTSEEGIPVVVEMLKAAGLTDSEAKRRIIVLTTSLHWAGAPYVPIAPVAQGFAVLADLLGRGALPEEEKFEGKSSYETVYLCYSSGTTGKPKGVEVRWTNHWV